MLKEPSNSSPAVRCIAQARGRLCVSEDGKTKTVIFVFPSFSTAGLPLKMAAHPCAAEALNKSEAPWIQITARNNRSDLMWAGYRGSSRFRSGAAHIPPVARRCPSFHALPGTLKEHRLIRKNSLKTGCCNLIPWLMTRAVQCD